MSAPISSVAEAAGVIRVDLDAAIGWRRVGAGSDALWFKGHLYGAADPATIAAKLAAAGLAGAADAIAELDGHFALVFEGPGWTMAATDRIASIPLAYASDGDGWAIDGEAVRLAQRLGLGEIEPGAALAIAMAGYTIGRASLYRGIEALAPGEAVLFRGGADPERRRYYAYAPRPRGDGASAKDLLRVTRRVFEKTIAGLDGRTVLIPLSAGLDSRLVASALAELGYRNVKCFSYGRIGNHEALAGRRIAERLGLPWTFVPHSPAQQKAHFESADCRAYERYADTLQAIPFQQDFHAVQTLKENGYAPQDAVFVNGQSGDYITGHHIPDALLEPSGGSDEEAAWRRVLDAAIAKHFDLWSSLKTPGNLARIERLLRDDLAEAGLGPGDPAEDFARYEASEFRNRQSKYVVAGQRTYEWFGFEWRLPLWDREYLDFWAAAPLAAKARQRLYRETLVAADWGGVWGDGFWPARTITPGWMRPIRFAAKAAHAPLGRARWHRFERRYIAWWIDPVCNYAAAPYAVVARDRRGQRNAISWHAERYLGARGLDIEAVGSGAGT